MKDISLPDGALRFRPIEPEDRELLYRIYAATRVLFPHSEESRNGWVSRANTAHLFGGRSPLEIMRSGMIGLHQTFAHLSAARAW